LKVTSKTGWTLGEEATSGADLQSGGEKEVARGEDEGYLALVAGEGSIRGKVFRRQTNKDRTKKKHQTKPNQNPRRYRGWGRSGYRTKGHRMGDAI